MEEMILPIFVIISSLTRARYVVLNLLQTGAINPKCPTPRKDWESPIISSGSCRTVYITYSILSAGSVTVTLSIDVADCK